MSLPGDRYVHDEARHALTGLRTGESYRLGDRVEVKLLEVTPVSGGMRFEMVSEGRRGERPPRPAGPGRRPFHGKRASRRR